MYPQADMTDSPDNTAEAIIRVKILRDQNDAKCNTPSEIRVQDLVWVITFLAATYILYRRLLTPLKGWTAQN